MFVYICGRLTVLCNLRPRRTRKMSSRLRQKPQTEEEDAAALKLGPGGGQVFFHVIVLKGSHQKSSTTLGVC